MEFRVLYQNDHCVLVFVVQVVRFWLWFLSDFTSAPPRMGYVTLPTAVATAVMSRLQQEISCDGKLVVPPQIRSRVIGAGSPLLQHFYDLALVAIDAADPARECNGVLSFIWLLATKLIGRSRLNEN